MSQSDSPACLGTMPRRAFLRASLTGFSALGVSDLMRLQAAASTGGASGGPSMIVVWLWGGPSHMETFDMKPDAPEAYRGLFKPIPTSVPGIEICEKLPRLAEIADKLAIVRSITHDSPGHANSTHTVLTGYTGDLVEQAPFTPKQPYVFHAANKFLPDRADSLPKWVALPNLPYEGGGALGRTYGPFKVAADPNKPDFKVPELVLDEARRARLGGRSRLLAGFDGARRALEETAATRSFDVFQRRALDVLTSPSARDAFDLAREPDVLRDRYGRNVVGQRCLLARRLVESGVRLVTIDFPCVPGQKAFSWDDHASVWNIFEQMEIRLPVLDQAVSALIEDVHARGLDKETLIVVMGEMGRTPKLSNHQGQPGREHWGKAMSVLMSGGGMPMGQVIGATTARGEEPKERRFTPNDLLATWYRYLGIDHTQYYPDVAGRPIALLPHGDPISELI
ncbi:DUF1501 domain-containing protein [Planctomyces sp. SH-PL62]|uniref:DUF1501 domain-containing protein n=1 Tax=Planctomyces sp. SH-PL62 TaxID=1636152 RepID=UPI00078C4E8C|nr:DUF1501 domain-containing protein [Planctomyces sp. SH-PL62]AMV37738.1 hypothetical protein VT85_09900 [Planctomyces sp. SH-PL62]